jgi:hypothetical protein
LVTLKLFVNCNTFVNALQFLNVPEKDVTFVLVSNSVDGTVVKFVQARKQDANVVANVGASNSPDGTVVIVVMLEKLSVNVVAFGEKSKRSAGIAVILVPLINDAKLVTSLNPVYPPTPLKDALPGIAVKFAQP